jgi:hypothetical protein
MLTSKELDWNHGDFISRLHHLKIVLSIDRKVSALLYAPELTF